jgi:hypothetical protein
MGLGAVTCRVHAVAGLGPKFLEDLLDHGVTGDGGPDGRGRDGSLDPPQFDDDTEPFLGRWNKLSAFWVGPPPPSGPRDRRSHRDSEASQGQGDNSPPGAQLKPANGP